MYVTRRQPTIDFDHHSEEYLADRLSQWRKTRESPVAYSPRYGGFWVVSGHARGGRGVPRRRDV